MPDHTGTTVFLLLGCLLVDRALSWRWTAPLLCLLLCAGQLGDVTVRYVYVPAIVLVCALVVARTRRLRSADTAIVAAALGSVPLSLAVRAVLRHLGAYQMVAPRTAIAPVSSWAHNAAKTWQELRFVFGAQAPGGGSAGEALFGSACLLAVAVGFGWTLWRWRTAERVDQVLVVAIAVNLGVYAISTMALRATPQELTGVPVLSAALVARTRCRRRSPAAGRQRSPRPCSRRPWCRSASSRPSPRRFRPGSGSAPGYRRRGFATVSRMYWDAPQVTMMTSGEVQLRTVMAADGKINPFEWETENSWFNPAENYANFVVCLRGYPLFSRTAERFFGRPASIRDAGNWVILIYDRNLIEQVSPVVLHCDAVTQ